VGDQLSVLDYVLVALLRLGGDTTMVDLEDVAVEAHRLSPGRFSWRRHDYPNLEYVRVATSGSNKDASGLVLRERYGRMLTVEGAARAREVMRIIDADPGLRDDTIRRKDLADLARMEAHPAFLAWRELGVDGPDAVDLADLARCSLSTPLSVFQDRLRRAEAIAAHWNRDELARFLGEAADHLPVTLAQETR
jgi:hypothetical protein